MSKAVRVQQVLQKVRGAEHTGSLVTRAHPHPEPNGHAASTGHFFGNHAHATGQDGAAHLVTAHTLVDEAATLKVELLGDGLKFDGQGNRHEGENLSAIFRKYRTKDARGQARIAEGAPGASGGE